MISDRSRIHGGFTGRVIGSTLGIPIEGMSCEDIRGKHGFINSYVGIKSNRDGTFDGVINDDEVYEIILLLTLEEKGRGITSLDIARNWLKMIPGFEFVFTAERVALERFRKNIFLFGDDLVHDNPFHDYIGAQMRGEMCGWVYPRQIWDSARLAEIDARVSHAGDGIIGEKFIAAMISNAFLIPDEFIDGSRVDAGQISWLVSESEKVVPANSLYSRVIREIKELHSRNPDDWLSNFREFRGFYESEIFEELYQGSDEARRRELMRSFHVHVLPNAGIILLALLHGGGDFTGTLGICAGCGLDTDCNCGNVGAILGTVLGFDNIPLKWKVPINNTFLTVVNGWEEERIDVISNRICRLSRVLGNPRDG
ncbi:MAG: ADP-ribosylglycohydrolase family protein [Promethearchaeota archaeon]